MRVLGRPEVDSSTCVRLSGYWGSWPMIACAPSWLLYVVFFLITYMQGWPAVDSSVLDHLAFGAGPWLLVLVLDCCSLCFSRLHAREDGKQKVCIAGLTERQVANEEALMQVSHLYGYLLKYLVKSEMSCFLYKLMKNSFSFSAILSQLFDSRVGYHWEVPLFKKYPVISFHFVKEQSTIPCCKRMTVKLS